MVFGLKKNNSINSAWNPKEMLFRWLFPGNDGAAVSREELLGRRSLRRRKCRKRRDGSLSKYSIDFMLF